MSENMKPVDLNDLYLEDESLQLDPDADAFQGPPPPPDGVHLAKIMPFRKNGDSPFQVGKDKRSKPFIMAAVVNKAVAEGRPWDGANIFDRVSSVIMQNSGTCRMAGVLKALGITVPATTTMKGLARMLETALAGEPMICVETQWQARAQHGDKWVTILRGMKKFPQKPDGSYSHIVDDPETGEKVTAQAVVLRYLPADKVKA
jgi:hypothetical protein